MSLISYFSKHICICANKCSLVHVHISIHKYIFSVCINMFAKYVKHPQNIQWHKKNNKINKSGSAQEKSKGHKKRAINPTVQN